MCNFLSLVETERHRLFFFLPDQRIAHSKKPLTDKHGNAYRMDSHASICAFYGLDEDTVNKYEWDPYTRKITIDQRCFDVDKDRVQKGIDEIDWRPICGDIEGLRAFCDRMKEIPFFKKSGILPDGVKLFKDRDAAWAAAVDAAWDADRNAVITYACDGLQIEARHVEYTQKRWSIWEAGYGVLCDVDGVLYCYEKP